MSSLSNKQERLLYLRGAGWVVAFRLPGCFVGLLVDREVGLDDGRDDGRDAGLDVACNEDLGGVLLLYK